MSTFWDKVDEYIGNAFSVADITNIVVRRCWEFDFKDEPIRLWEGQGRLHTSDSREWLGIIDAVGNRLLEVPSINDGRDGSSATYSFTMKIPDVPGKPAYQTYEELRSMQNKVSGRNLTVYLALFDLNDGLRPETPIVFSKHLTMFSTTFAEKLLLDGNNAMKKQYTATVKAKDGNSGRSNVPMGSYSPSIQAERARQLGVAVDKGCDFVPKLANRTYQLP